MMNYGFGPTIGGGAFGLLSEVVWLIAGAMLIVWLWKQISQRG